jgi:hypothetical protein
MTLVSYDMRMNTIRTAPVPILPTKAHITAIDERSPAAAAESRIPPTRRSCRERAPGFQEPDGDLIMKKTAFAFAAALLAGGALFAGASTSAIMVADRDTQSAPSYIDNVEFLLGKKQVADRDTQRDPNYIDNVEFLLGKKQVADRDTQRDPNYIDNIEFLLGKQVADRDTQRDPNYIDNVEFLLGKKDVA